MRVSITYGLLLLLIAFSGSALAQPAPSKRTLVVAVKPIPPFVIKRADGSFSGISITLWKDIANQLNLNYRFQQTSLDGLLDGVAKGAFDAGVGALTVTAEREAKLSFTQPFYITGLGIAVRPERGGAGWWTVLTRFFSWQFLLVVLTLVGLLLGVGLLVWLFEHKKNPEMFGGRPRKGIASSFWWAAVTMTTVGYGDTAPVMLGGRLVGLVWMFAAIIVISSFTASITSSLTVGRLGGRVHGPNDLPRVRVASVTQSTSAEYLHNHRVRYRAYDTVKKGLTALVKHHVDAVVYDAPTLKYAVKQHYPNKAVVLHNTFDQQEYAFALHAKSALRKPINIALLKIVHGPSWQGVLYRFLGKP